jgi:hypothetical protein
MAEQIQFQDSDFGEVIGEGKLFIGEPSTFSKPMEGITRLEDVALHGAYIIRHRDGSQKDRLYYCIQRIKLSDSKMPEGYYSIVFSPHPKGISNDNIGFYPSHLISYCITAHGDKI